jgi:sortase A
MVLIAAGVLLIADAVVTVAWQEPLSAVLAQRSQHRLAKQLDELDQAVPSAVQQRTLRRLRTDDRRIAFAARALRRSTPTGGALGRIVLPTLHRSYVMVNGTDTASLRKGPGVYPETPMPGAGGTTGIAGHRTTYLAPFRTINDLEHGDHIVLEMPYATLTYAVQRLKIVQPDDLSVIKPVGYQRVVLTACNPLYSAAQRIVAFARLVKAVPSRRIADVGATSSGR